MAIDSLPGLSTPAEYRLLGPPGAGKTEALSTQWIPRAADKFGGKGVLVCSLTRAAAKEIRDRTAGIPSENVGTLHALAYRALGRPKLAEVEVADWNEIHPELALTELNDSGLDEPLGPGDRSNPKPGEDDYALTQALRHRCVPRDEWPERALAFQTRWEAWQHDSGCCDFTALIEQCLDDEVPTPSDAAMLIVDEAQDCSALEMKLVRFWTRGRHLVLAGDPNQSIYGFRGADPRAFLETTLPPENVRLLRQSHRVPIAIHAAASEWFALSRDERLLEYAPRSAEGIVEGVPAFYRHAEGLVDELLAELEHVGGMVMLLAACGYMLEQTLAVLRRQAVPFFNPWRRNRSEWNPLAGAPTRLVAFLSACPEVHGTGTRLWSWQELKAWTPMLRAEGLLTPAGRQAIATKAANRELASWVPTMEQLLALFADGGVFIRGCLTALQMSAADGAAWLEAHLSVAASRSLRYGLDVLNEHGVRGLTALPRLVVGTIHATKGGQADSVVLLPDLSSAGYEQWARDPDAVVRQFYVGMTRAKERLLLCSPSTPRYVQW